MKLSPKFNCWYTAWHRFESGELALFQATPCHGWESKASLGCFPICNTGKADMFQWSRKFCHIRCKPCPATCPQGQTESQGTFYLLCIDIDVETNLFLTPLWLTLLKPMIYRKCVEIRESPYLLGVYFGEWGGIWKMWQSSYLKSNLIGVRPILLLPTNNSICCIMIFCLLFFKPFFYQFHSYQLGLVVSSTAQPSTTFCSWMNEHTTACSIYLLPVI